MFRFFIFVLITILMLTPFFWLAIPLAVIYTFYFTGYELMILAIMLDGYFGAFYTLPLISIFTIFLVYLMSLLKPLLLMYTER